MGSLGRKFIGTAVLSFALVLGHCSFVQAQEMQEETQTADVSDMVYQAGGFGTTRGVRAAEEPVLCAVADRSGLKADMFTTLLRGDSFLDVRGYGLTGSDWEEIKTLFSEILNENPQLFYVKPILGNFSSGGSIQKLNFSFESFSNAEQREYDAKLEEVASLVNDSMSDEEKALVFHDYLAQHCVYAYSEYLAGTGALASTPHVYDAYGALVKGKAVCQGYTMAYKALLNKVGIESTVCNSNAMGHIWNTVLVDGQWYHVDVTWDDPAWNTEGLALHEYFLLSDAEMAGRNAPKNHHDWDTVVACNSTKYDSKNYWWTSVTSQIVVLGSKYYIVPGSAGGFQLLEQRGDSILARYSNLQDWKIWGSAASYFKPYSFLSKQGNYLFFNDRTKLYAMDPSKGTPQPVYTYTNGDGYIYGAMVYEDGKARLNIRKAPNEDSDDYIVVDVMQKLNSFTSNTTYKAVSSLIMGRTTLILEEGKSDKLTVGVRPVDATNKKVEWSSNNPDVAEVDEDGKVTAVSIGTAVVTVRSTDGSDKSASCTVSVIEAKEKIWVTAVKLDKSSVNMLVGNSSRITVSIEPENATRKKVKWSSSNTSVATVDENGNVTAVETGSAVITAAAADGSGKSAACSVTIAADEGWNDIDGLMYWYEGNVRQGTVGRGKEIYDPDSDAWYWLDAVQNGAVAKSKDVYQDSKAGVYAENPDGTGKWVRYNARGQMIKGWDITDRGTYYFDPVTGAMAKGTVVVEQDGGKTAYEFDVITGIKTGEFEVADDFVMFGWNMIDNVPFWFEGGVKQGVFGRGKEIYNPDTNSWYWLDSVDGGKMAVSKDIYQESEAGEWGEKIAADGKKYGKWVRYDADGCMIKGWCAGKSSDAIRIDSPDQANGRRVYYFDLIYGTMAKGRVSIDGTEYYFDPKTGVLQ